jgi:DNA-directed RNA polymerase III subunit RPC3
LQIYALCQHAGLKAKQIRYGLTVLLQQNLIFFFESGSGTYYEANESAVYGLIRIGKILEAVDIRHGSLARDLIQQLFLLGHAPVSDVLAAYGNQKSLSNGFHNGHAAINGINGAVNHTDSYSDILNPILGRLLQAGLVRPFTKRLLRSPMDTYNQAEQKLLKLEKYAGGVKGPKAKAELKGEIRAEMQKVFRREEEERNPRGKKRARNGLTNGVNGNGKRRKVSTGGYAINGYAINGDFSHDDEDNSLEVGCLSI